VNAVMNLRVKQKTENFFSSLLCRILLHGVRQKDTKDTVQAFDIPKGSSCEKRN
jgi:hypothetical protein